MKDGMIPVKVYHNRMLADMARVQLVEQGIEALIHTDNAGGMRPDLDLMHGVALLVSPQHAAEARDILAIAEPDGNTPGWTCGFCGETCEEQFAACWQCGQRRP